jgi:hypothetical protein
MIVGYGVRTFCRVVDADRWAERGPDQGWCRDFLSETIVVAALQAARHLSVTSTRITASAGANYQTGL